MHTDSKHTNIIHRQAHSCSSCSSKFKFKHNKTKESKVEVLAILEVAILAAAACSSQRQLGAAKESAAAEQGAGHSTKQKTNSLNQISSV